MSSAIRKAVAQTAAPILEASGFEQVSTYCVERPLEHLAQGIEFQPGTGVKKGQFTVNLYWRYTNSPIVKEEAMHFSERLGRFLGGGDEWYDGSSVKAARSSAELACKVIEDRVLTFFDRFRDVREIIEAFEQGELEPHVLFGPDRGWQAYHRGYCYLSLGQLDKARESLFQVVRDFSDPDLGWIRDRRLAAQTTLDSLDRG